MTIAQWCVLAACLMPILTVGLAKVSLARMPRKLGGYDNFNPREWEAKLDGWRARAHAAQLNGYEALPLFIAGGSPRSAVPNRPASIYWRWHSSSPVCSTLRRICRTARVCVR